MQEQKAAYPHGQHFYGQRSNYTVTNQSIYRLRTLQYENSAYKIRKSEHMLQVPYEFFTNDLSQHDKRSK